ncbi:MAG TPA: redoxin domain-containing protein, partial [Thermomicrobiales bacterium]|nr:redoxin domain-containing protein [Thermomicrobiales bacterium]
GDLSNAERVVAVVAALAFLAAIAEAWLLIHLLSQNGRVLLRIDAVETMLKEGVPAAAAIDPAPATNGQRAPGLAVGSPAPTFRLEGLHGETMTLDALRASGRPVMLVFTDPGCGPCNALLPDLGKWQRDYSNKLDIAVLSRGKPEANKAKAAEHGLSRVLLQQDREVAQLYEAYGTPSAVIVRPDGTIGSPLAGGAEAIRNLVSKSTGTLSIAAAPVPPRPAAQPQPAPAGNGAPAPAAPRAAVGAAAPVVSLPDVNGKTVNLSDFKGDRTAVLFWNPGCGFCKRMLDDLKAWEDNPPKGSTKLLVVSTGEPAANTALGLKSPLVLDQGFAVGRAFGASGTPSAVLVDANGKVASDVVVGGPAVMALVRGEDPAKANGGAPAAAAPKAASKGDPAPTVKLSDITGKQFDLKSRRGGKTMLLFWNPGCGFCKRMLDDLKAWEENPPKGAPKLVVVSTGTVESNEALGLKSTILLDEGFSVGRTFGASGTPSAVLIDAKGNIASDVAVGAPGVLALAGATPKEPAATA